MNENPVSPSRRKFIRSLSLILPGLGLMNAGLASPFSPFATGHSPGQIQGITMLNLQVADPLAVIPFYTEVLEFQLVSQDSSKVSFQAGTTLLTFQKAEEGFENARYHFAFNIPENQLANSMAWIKKKIPLMRKWGKEVFHFSSWNSHSVYFYDTAGNILEFIARHDLDNSQKGEFVAEHILYVSEIGLVVDDVKGAVSILEEDMGVSPYRKGYKHLVPVGNEHQLLIVTKRDRVWLPTKGDRAAPYPVETTFSGRKRGEFRLKGYPYTVDFQE